MAFLLTAIKWVWWNYKSDVPLPDAISNFVIPKDVDPFSYLESNIPDIARALGMSVDKGISEDYGDRLHRMEEGYYPLDLLGFDMTITNIGGVKCVLPTLAKGRVARGVETFKTFKRLSNADPNVNIS